MQKSIAARSRVKTALFTIVTLLFVAVVLELLSSAFLFYRYKSQIYEYEQDPSGPSTLILLRTACHRLGLCNVPDAVTVRADPAPLYVADSGLGYAAVPGRHVITYSRHHAVGPDDLINVNVTINADGSRSVGSAVGPVERNVYVFGDSFIFGEGVNDEQTFTALLQNAFPRSQFHLYAAGGYSLTQAYVTLERLHAQLRPDDLVILGYADWYKVRIVAAPSRLREYGDPLQSVFDAHIQQLRASVDPAGRIAIDFVPVFCKFSNGYCDQPDPPAAVMDRVTEGLIDAIVDHSAAKVVLLHFDGATDDPVLAAVKDKLPVWSVTERDFSYRIRDDIMGFNRHPGPYWHYAIYSRVAELLRAGAASVPKDR